MAMGNKVMTLNRKKWIESKRRERAVEWQLSDAELEMTVEEFGKKWIEDGWKNLAKQTGEEPIKTIY